jgi:hypothetical protein
MAFAQDTDTDTEGEVISLNGESAGTTPDEGAGDTAPKTPEDRGDVVDTGKLSKDDLLAVVKDAPDDTKPNGIPKARFDEVNEAKKAAQSALDAANAEIAALKAVKAAPQAETAPAFDEDAKEQEYIDAMLDGDTALALRIRKEINANLREQASVEFEARQEQMATKSTMEAESAQAVADYPYLETEEGAFALSLIVSARNDNIAKGIPAPLALRQAVAAIAPKFAPDSDPTPSSDSTTERSEPDTRTVNALKRGANDSNHQPPSLQAGIGTRITGARINVEALDEGQFKALSLADKKRLRGD